MAGNFDFYAVSKHIWQIYMLNTDVLEHTVIVVPLTMDCNITEGGWHSLVSRKTVLWPGKPGFSNQYEQRLSPSTFRPAVEPSQPPIHRALGVISPEVK